MYSIASPVPQFFDLSGDALDAGKIYIGTAGSNPETSPVALYWDDAGTQPAAQPIRTVSGFPARNGKPARVYVATDDFSITVKTRQDLIVYTELNVLSMSSLRADLIDKSNAAKGASLIGHSASLNYAAATIGAVLNDVCINAKMFPWLAKGDGVTDDTAAIQAAGNAAIASRARMILPAGNFRVGSLTFTGAGGFDLTGVRSGHTNKVGTVLTYTGTGNCLNFADGSGNFMYRVMARDFAIFFEQNANAGVYGKNLQECTFQNIGVWAESKTVQNAFDIDGAGIVNIDNCISSRCIVGINLHFGTNPNPQATGGVNITRNNIYLATNSIVCGYTLQMNIENNWFEGFQNGILIDNADPKLRTEVAGLFITKNVFIQSTNGLSETRAVAVKSTENARPIRISGTVRDNYCFMNSSGATASSYAVSVTAASNASVVDGRLTVENNEFYGVSVAGTYNDSTKVIVSCTKNKVRDDLWGDWLPEYAGAGARLFDMQALSHSAVFVNDTATTAETAFKTLTLPANMVGPNGAVRITASYTCTNNSNTKDLRMRLNDIAGPIISQHSAASSGRLNVTAILSNRNSMTTQYAQSVGIGATASAYHNTGALTFMTNDVSILLTYQKGSASDSIVLEMVSVELIQP